MGKSNVVSLDDFRSRMKALRGDYGTCGICNERFFKGASKTLAASSFGSPQIEVHTGCVIVGTCYACSQYVHKRDPRNTDTNEYGGDIVYHDKCTIDAKTKINQRIKAVQEAALRSKQLNEDRAKRQERDGRLERQAQSHMVQGQHANIFVINRRVCEDRAGARARAEGAHMASSNPMVRAVSFDHLSGTMNFIVYDLEWLQGRTFTDQPALVTWAVAKAHPEAEGFLRSRGFDPVYVEGEM